MRLIVLFGLALMMGQTAATISQPAFAGASGEDKKARKQAQQAAIRLAVSRGELIAMPRLLAIARERVAGDVLEVELEANKRGRIIYEVKILTPGGRVREVEVDARTGAVIKMEDD